MKCRRCREPAVIDIRRHNAAFCRDCFLHHCREQVRRAIDEHEMLGAGERVLVAVSGGKDSLAPLGPPRASSATTPTGSTSGSGSATTRTSPGATRARSRPSAG